MKIIAILLFILLTFEAFADMNVDVISSEYPVEDYLQKKTLCLTIVRVPQTGALLGIVESLEDCFYARKAQKAQRISLRLNDLMRIQDLKMREHLQRIDTQLEFYYSDGE